MEISLIRHGRSTHTDRTWINASQFGDWVKQYDAAGVFIEANFPEKTKRKMTNAKLIVTSDLTRSIHSAHLLSPQANIVSSPLFREVGMPRLSFTKIKAPPALWSILLRGCWLLGYSSQTESLLQAKKRAKEASAQLIRYTTEYETILLVGHGFFNRLTAQELEKAGWRSKTKTSRKYWNCTTYFFN
ncbi:histidine phosphatase family protein [Bacillus sp. FJAT-42315]|uniref:histidine phosphatase family protein n=1 Tax=Bacillus sp. FJAT-42315 TaxID=2014077 RepID=UPI000C249C4C|nr:histidine phosphatase family protein [Bacillus sp. FJAT-42315]